MKSAKLEEIGSQKDIKTKALLYRYHKSGNPLKEALMIQELMKTHTQEEVGELLKLSQGQISKRLRLLSLHPDLQFRLLHDKLRPSTAYALSKLSEAKQREYLTKDRITLKEVEATHRNEAITEELMQHLVTSTIPEETKATSSNDADLSEQDRERFRSRLLELAEDVRMATNWSILQVRAFLRELLEVSV